MERIRCSRLHTKYAGGKIREFIVAPGNLIVVGLEVKIIIKVAHFLFWVERNSFLVKALKSIRAENICALTSVNMS